ncbi:hypothetical protein [Halobacterium jilantaiense]|uniref:Uncharacterized protein n=1 Tax=Halobacterium jilantaiense TaxID=355548 RepID=A0A1I0QAP9_9EURY|nr:hypothetical protein [Halobacterium jilantaiense]SEW23873.1 hypothetical protein SAMN04487945_2420 [Halobacterium jilantaiense]
MQRKPVPPAPQSLTAVADVVDAVPLVPKPEDDCCRRLVDRAEVPDRGRASSWLVFLAALGVLDDDAAGYARGGDVPLDDTDALAANFRENVFLAAETVDALGDGPRSPADVFAVVRERVPRWERAKRDNWPEFWTGRVERRLDWAVLLGLAEREGDSYVAARD